MCAHDGVALPMEKRLTHRRFVAMDIENIHGGAVSKKEFVDAAWRKVADAIHLSDNEQVVIGVGPSSLLAAGMSVPTARLVMCRGPSGADHAPIEVLREECIADRFDEVVIVSGDGILADAAAWLASRGVEVSVVARNGHLSSRLRLAAGKLVFLPDHAPLFGQTA